MQPGTVPAYAQGLSPQHAEQLRQHWVEVGKEVQATPLDPAVFKNSILPLARIKKVLELGDGCWPGLRARCEAMAHGDVCVRLHLGADHEVGRGRAHDQRRGAGALCQGPPGGIWPGLPQARQQLWASRTRMQRAAGAASSGLRACDVAIRAA